MSTVVTMTAADAMYNLIKAPLRTDPDVTDKPMLIWGGFSNVGLCAIQCARANGFQNIFATASSSRHELLRGIGAIHSSFESAITILDDLALAAIPATSR